MSRQKIYRACNQCVSSKTRCQDVTAEGCSRCRSRSKACSLLEPAFGGLAVSDGALEDLVGKLDRVEHGLNSLVDCVSSMDGRISTLENRIPDQSHLSAVSHTSLLPHDVTQHQPSSVVGSSHTQSQIPSPFQTRDSHANATLQHGLSSRTQDLDLEYWTGSEVGPGQLLPNEPMFSFINADRFPDPMPKGGYTKHQVDTSFQLFKHRFSSLILVAPFLLTSTPTPSHPFVQTAILAHTLPSPALNSIIDESILRVHSGAVSEGVLLALLILSLVPAEPAPSSAGSLTLSPAHTGVRYIHLAYSLGNSLGMEGLARTTLKRREVLVDPGWESRLQRLLLWETIKNRYNILTMLHTRSFSLAGSLAAELPGHPADHLRSTIRHIQTEAELVSIFAAILEDLCLLEEDWIGEMPDLAAVMNRWDGLRQSVNMFTDTKCTESLPRLLLYDARCLYYIFTFRLSCSTQRIPSPLNAETRNHHLGFVGISFVKTMVAMIRFFTADLPPEVPLSEQIPHYALFTFGLSIFIARRTLNHFKRAYPGNEHTLRQDMVSAAEQRLVAEGGVVGCFVTHLQPGFPGDDPPFDTGGMSSGGAGDWDPTLNATFANMGDFDWSTLFGGGMEGLFDSTFHAS